MSERLKQLRLAQGYSLEELSSQMGGLVTKQALSKYEKGAMNPSPSVMLKLASALGVKSADLFNEVEFTFKKLEYRKKATLSKKTQESMQAAIQEDFNQRLRLQTRMPGEHTLKIKPLRFTVKTANQAEEAASRLRADLNLGVDPIADLTAVLEDHLVHVIYIQAPEKFDGFSMLAYGKRKAAAISAAAAGRVGVSGDRQRLTLAHELGHLVFKEDESLEHKVVEKLAFRFAAAFLVPRESFIEEIGEKRTSLNLEELLILKQRFGVSIQALVYRMHDLKIISEPTFKSVFMQMSRLGWRKKEPGKPYPVEESTWVRQTALRAWSEGILSEAEAKSYLGEIPDDAGSSSLMRKQKFLKLSKAQRNQILAEQAKKFEALYNETNDWDSIETEGWS